MNNEVESYVGELRYLRQRVRELEEEVRMMREGRRVQPTNQTLLNEDK